MAFSFQVELSWAGTEGTVIPTDIAQEECDHASHMSGGDTTGEVEADLEGGGLLTLPFSLEQGSISFCRESDHEGRIALYAKATFNSAGWVSVGESGFSQRCSMLPGHVAMATETDDGAWVAGQATLVSDVRQMAPGAFDDHLKALEASEDVEGFGSFHDIQFTQENSQGTLSFKHVLVAGHLEEDPINLMYASGTGSRLSYHTSRGCLEVDLAMVPNCMEETHEEVEEAPAKTEKKKKKNDKKKRGKKGL